MKRGIGTLVTCYHLSHWPINLRSQAAQSQPPDEPYYPVVVGLANQLPQVGQTCENPATEEAELDKLLSEATDALEGLREITMSEVAV